MEECIAFVLHFDFFSNVNEAYTKVKCDFLTDALHCYNRILKNIKFGMAREFPSEKCNAKNMMLRKM